MSAKAAAERDLRIPIPAEPNRRLDCLADPLLFLPTYFSDVFFEDFTDDRRDMITSIVNAALYGGDQAIAGPRGEGKTTLGMYAALYLMLSNLSVFPLVVGKSQEKASGELKSIKLSLQQNPLLIADFPEVCIPFESVGGWSSRARMQTVAGTNTNIEVAAKHLVFPKVARDQLPYEWPDAIEPASCGQVLGSIGIDGGLRGAKYGKQRPTIVIIDDLEDREAAESEVLIAKHVKIIEEDIAGLGASAERVSRVMLCTTQNRKCVAYTYTDPKQKPSWRGKRYRKMVRTPDRMDLVQQYITLRVERSVDDPDAREAFRFWRDNQEAIEAGCVVSNVQSYSKKLHLDGEPLELSAIQAYYNRVADTSQESVSTEIDNDPPLPVGPQGMGLTKEIVLSRCSGLARLQCPANASLVTAAIDLGKYACHWAIVAWWKGGGGCVVDYGVAEVIGTHEAMDNVASEPMVYRALLNWRDELLSTEIVDATGQPRKVGKVFIDSGTFTDSAYEFVRQVGPPFFATKGVSNYRDKKTTDTTIGGKNQYAEYQHQQKVWLWMLHSDYWKQWVHERFLTPTFDEANFLRRGALSLYLPAGNKKHTTFAQHIVAEQLVTEFKQGKGEKTYWDVVNRNNHWLDAMAMCAAAAGSEGIDVMAGTTVNPDGPRVQPKAVSGDKPRPKPSQQHGRFRQRPGGWIQGIRRR